MFRSYGSFDRIPVGETKGCWEAWTMLSAIASITSRVTLGPFVACTSFREPALLVWLDAPANRKGHPNENLARELMELFTVGIGHYGEADVKEAARALTGWTTDEDGFQFKAAAHDEGTKTLLGRTGHWTGDDLVKMLLEHPATADRLAWRLCGLFFSEGLPVTPRATDLVQEIDRVTAAAARANVTIYAFDPRGLDQHMGAELLATGVSPSVQLQQRRRLSSEMLRGLSEETGGFAAVNRNDFSDAFSRVVKDSSAYYVLGYYPKNDRRDGRFRKIEVRVKRPGVEVRSRRGYTAPRGKAPEPPKTPPGDKTSPQIREALGSPLPLSSLTLAVAAAPFKGTAPKSSVSVTIEAEGRDFGFEEKDGKLLSDYEVSTIALDKNAKIRGGDRSVVNFALRPENRDRFSQSGVRVSTRLELEPGRYQLRIAARESATGRVGSINYDLDVPDFTKEPLVLSGVVVSSPTEASVSPKSPSGVMNRKVPAFPSFSMASVVPARNAAPLLPVASSSV